MILLTGATGKVGTALVAALRAQQLPFRALAHSEASHQRLREQDVDSTLAPDLSGDQAVAAFAGVDRLFVLTPSHPQQAATERQLVDRARHSGVRRIVKLSVFGVDDPDVSLFQAHRESEQYIRQAGLTYTFLRPNLFMQNLGNIDAPLVREQSAIFNAAGDGVISFIDTRDIAEVAAAVMRDERHGGQTYNLTGAEALSYGTVAEQLSVRLGRPIQYVALTDDAYHGALQGAGLPDWYATGLSGLYRFYRAGKGSPVTNLVEQLTGRRPRTLDGYLAEHQELFA